MSAATDLLIDAIRDHIEAVAPSPLSTCSFVIRDQAATQTFPQVRVSERSVEEHDILVGVYTSTVDVTLRTIPDDTGDSIHYSMSQDLWNIVGDDEIELSLSSVNTLKVHDVRCAGPMSEPEDDYRQTVMELRCVYHQE